MKIKCIAKTGNDLSPKAIKTGQSEKTVYPIYIGKTYIVYCIRIWKGCLDYFIDISGQPGWYPAELFELVDHTVPSEWFFSFRGYDQTYPLYAIFGYKEMVFDTVKHNTDLFECEPEAREIFKKRQQELDAYEEIRNILINKKGTIISGEKTGWSVYIKNDIANSGGYLVNVSKGTETYLEDWLETKEDLRQLFNRKEWKIEWEN